MPTLNFLGKTYVQNHHLAVPHRQLVPKPDLSVASITNGQKSTCSLHDNLIVQGDNLEALKALLPTYSGKVKCIYIDPPYNTGNEGWVYNDNVKAPLIKEWLGNTVGKEGEDLTRHDKWLCMMTPRLKLLRELLTEDGVIFVSIGDEEQGNLRQIMDEFFGDENFISNIIWQRAYAPVNMNKYFSQNHDFILCYAKNKEQVKLNDLSRSEEQDARYKNPDNDERGDWKSVDFSVGPAVEKNIYEISTPSGRIVTPPQGRSWVVTKEKLEELKLENRVWFGVDGSATPSTKKFLTEVKQGVVHGSIKP
jgi:adenine-specific DNA-methyltransferase